MADIAEPVKLKETAADPVIVEEAATRKTRVLRMLRDMDETLKDKTLPADARKALETMRATLKKTWKELAGRAALEGGAHTTETAGGTDGEMEEGDYYDGMPVAYVPPAVVSFAQLSAANAAEEMAQNLRGMSMQFSGMVQNILWSDAGTVPDKVGAMRTLMDEFMLILEDAFSAASGDADALDAETAAESFAETEPAAAILVEADGVPADSLAVLDVQIIRPGWGNKRDNHFYSREMLGRDAARFVGAKMYETDHRENEKSTRTWVSTIKEIRGFSDEGAPIARVVVHDPSFAQRARNLASAGMLERMECSILASGKAVPGYEEGGRRGKRVDSILEVQSVDWVTTAGAGGHALALAESAADPDPEDVAETTPAAETEPAPVEPVNITETETETEPAAETDAAETEPAAPTMAAELVRARLAETHLPPAVVLDLAFAEYESLEELNRAIASATARIKEITGSGRPFGMGETANGSRPVQRVDVDKTIRAINNKFFGG